MPGTQARTPKSKLTPYHTVIAKGTIKRIHVWGQRIKADKQNGTKQEVFSVVTSKKTYHGVTVFIKGNSNLVYRPEKPLSNGAVAWIETLAEVEIVHV